MLTDPTPDPQLDVSRLEHGLLSANLPALLMVLYQLTGDTTWLEPPFQPHARFGMDPNDSGGFSDETQEQIRFAARDAIVDWNRGVPPADPRPTGDLLVKMMSLVVSEEVPPAYEPMLAQQMGFGERSVAEPVDLSEMPDFGVVVIGAGLGGLMTALRLKQAGIPFKVLEMSDHVAGVWWANRYPGAGVDTPSYLYPFSFFPQNWPTFFAKRDDVVRYVESFVDYYELRPYIEFDSEVTEARWAEAEQRWTLSVRSTSGDERTIDASVVVSSVGIFSRPKVPDLPGADSFDGPIFHSARWPDGLDLAGKSVALVGTGASAMQILPKIVDVAGRVTVFQRSPAWVLPVSNYFDEVPEDLHWLFENVPFYYGWYRFSLSWTFNDKLHPTLQIDPDWPYPERSINRTNDRHRARFTEYIESELGGRPDLLDKCLPDYPPWGKRMLIDNGWYAALRRDNVELITEGVTEILPHGVRTEAGTERPADIIVLSTGFHTTQYLFPMTVIGRDGLNLREHWNDDDARAYLGIASPGVPNLFFVYGPNTNGSGGSFLAWSESQVGYILQLLRAMIDRRLGSIEAKVEVHDRYNEEVDNAHSRMIWTHPGLTTYYRNSRGRVVVNVPWTVLQYWSRLRHANLDDYVTEPMHEVLGGATVSLADEYLGTPEWSEVAKLETIHGRPTQVWRKRLHNVVDLLEISAAQDDQVLLVHGDRRITFADFVPATLTGAAELTKAGVRPGDRVMIFSYNCAEFLLAMWAVWRAGAIPTLANRWWSERELDQVMASVRPALVITDAGDDHPSLSGSQVLSMQSLAKWWTGEPGPVPSRAGAAETDVALILYTAGSTGAPKGVQLSHLNLVITQQILHLMAGGRPPTPTRPEEQKVALMTTPMFHNGGVTASLTALVDGNRMVFLRNRFDPVEAMELIQRERANSWNAVPTMYSRLLRHDRVDELT